MVNSLDQVVDVFKKTHRDSAIQICDSQYYFKFAGTKLLDVFGLRENAVIHNRLKNIQSPVQHLYNQYYNLNSKVLSGEIKEVHYSTYIKSTNKLIIARNNVRPIIIKNEVSGLFIDTKFNDCILSFDFSIFSNQINDKPAILIEDPIIKNSIFSELEELIIFLIVTGKTDKEIADVLQLVGVFLSRAGVSKFITRNIFTKVNVDSRKQLISQVFYLGLMKKIPHLILNNQKLFNVTFN